MALGIAKIQVLCSSNPSCGAGPQEFFLGGVSMEMARGYCGILDGTSPMFVSPPLEDPRSRIGRCMNCGQPFTAKVIEFAEASQATH